MTEGLGSRGCRNSMSSSGFFPVSHSQKVLPTSSVEREVPFLAHCKGSFIPVWDAKCPLL